MRIGEHSCSECPDPITNAIRIILVFLVILGFLIYLIFSNLRKQEENQSAIIDKILTNYFHMVSALLSFNIPFPKFLYSLFKLIKDHTPRIETILSFDCFVQDTKIGIASSSEYLSRVFL